MEILQQFFQTALAFFSVLIFARLIGKQQLSQLTVYDYINGITIGSIAAVIATDEPEKMWQHAMDLLLFSLFTILISYLVLHNRPLRKLLDGEPSIIIHNGKILEENMRKNRYNMDDLLMQLREKNVFNISDVEYALLETDGVLTVLLKSQKRPITPADLNLPTQYEGLGHSLIIDGEILHENLEEINLTEAWLANELTKKGIHQLSDIIYAYMDNQGSLYIDIKIDNLSK